MQCYQHCANQAKVRIWSCWLLVVHAIANKYAIPGTRYHAMWYTQKTNKILSTLNLVELMCCLCIENTARISMALGFSFNFNVQLTTSRSLSRSTFSFVILFLTLSFSLAGLFSKLIVNSFYVVFFRI